MKEDSITDKELREHYEKFDKLLQNPPKKIKDPKLCYFYEKAKDHETKDRDLRLALKYYVFAAQEGEKIESCIKDFASVLHQTGRTDEGVKFLQRYRALAKGGQKYQNLIDNLKKQIVPSGKVFCKKILLTNIERTCNKSDIIDMFDNGTRIQSIQFYSSLSLQGQVDYSLMKKYCLLSFDSFSAAKKTLDTFKFDQWFGIDKYWTTVDNEIVCQAWDGRNDFEKILIKRRADKRWLYVLCQVPEYILQRMPMNTFRLLKFQHKCQNQQEANNIAIILIKECLSSFEISVRTEQFQGYVNFDQNITKKYSNPN